MPLGAAAARRRGARHRWWEVARGAAPGWRAWGLLLGVALLLRVLLSLVLVVDWPLVSDGSAYSEQAEELAADYPGRGEYYWPPGTSYVLWPAYELFGSSAAVARATMIVVSLATVVGTVHLARHLVREPAVALGAGWVMALLPSAVFSPAQPFSFDVTMLGIVACVLGVLVALDRDEPRWLPVAGLSLGAAVTARPGAASVLLALLPLLALAVRRTSGRSWPVRTWAAAGTALCLLALLPSVPAVLHHRSIGAGTTVSTNNEGNLLFGNNPYTRDYKTWHQGQHPFSDFPASERAYLEEHFTAGGSAQQRAEMRDEAVGYVLDHPARTAWRTLNRARAFWGFDYSHALGLRDAGWPVAAVGAVALLEIGGWGVFGCLVLVGAIAGRRSFRPGRLLLVLAVVGAYELPHLVAFSAGRWHLPVLALLAPVAAVGAGRLLAARGDLRGLLRQRALVAAVVAFLLVQVEYAWFLIAAA